jgi:hypothetical protein
MGAAPAGAAGAGTITPQRVPASFEQILLRKSRANPRLSPASRSAVSKRARSSIRQHARALYSAVFSAHGKSRSRHDISDKSSPRLRARSLDSPEAWRSFLRARSDVAKNHLAGVSVCNCERATRRAAHAGCTFSGREHGIRNRCLPGVFAVLPSVRLRKSHGASHEGLRATPRRQKEKGI